jgi:YjzC-like protein
MSTAVGSDYHTGQKAPVSGRYEFVRHTSPDSSCHPTAGERSIPLSRGERFPPCRSCDSGAVWRLAEVI